MSKLLIATALFFFTSNPVWINNLETAKAQAKKENKLILLNFSGSDWCIPCIRLHQEVFDNETFNNYAASNLVLVNADFPRRKKNQLTKEQQALNDALAERYNSKGSFPLTILLDSDGNKIKVWDGYYKDGVENFIREVREASEKL